MTVLVCKTEQDSWDFFKHELLVWSSKLNIPMLSNTLDDKHLCMSLKMVTRAKDKRQQHRLLFQCMRFQSDGSWRGEEVQGRLCNYQQIFFSIIDKELFPPNIGNNYSCEQHNVPSTPAPPNTLPPPIEGCPHSSQMNYYMRDTMILLGAVWTGRQIIAH